MFAKSILKDEGIDRRLGLHSLVTKNELQTHWLEPCGSPKAKKADLRLFLGFETLSDSSYCHWKVGERLSSAAREACVR